MTDYLYFRDADDHRYQVPPAEYRALWSACYLSASPDPLIAAIARTELAQNFAHRMIEPSPFPRAVLNSIAYGDALDGNPPSMPDDPEFLSFYQSWASLDEEYTKGDLP